MPACIVIGIVSALVWTCQDIPRPAHCLHHHSQSQLRTQWGECREERRWIERENARLRRAAKKDEIRRIRDFVERAYAADPRIAAQKEAAKAEKARKRQEKEDARLAKEQAAEAERIAAAEAAAAAAAEAQEVAEREKKAKCVYDVLLAGHGLFCRLPRCLRLLALNHRQPGCSAVVAAAAGGVASQRSANTRQTQQDRDIDLKCGRPKLRAHAASHSRC